MPKLERLKNQYSLILQQFDKHKCATKKSAHLSQFSIKTSNTNLKNISIKEN